MRLPAASVAALLLLLLPADTLVTAANGAASPIAAEQSWKHRLQARREDVLRRLSDISPRQLRSRSSPSSCDTGVCDDAPFVIVLMDSESRYRH